MPFWATFYLYPKARTGRLFYCLFGLLPLVVVGLCVGLIPKTLEAERYRLTVVYLLIWPQAVILARRLHDINMSGWWATLFWALPIALTLTHAPVPSGTGNIVGLVAAIVLAFIPGTRGPNRYGNDPSGNPSPSPSPADLGHPWIESTWMVATMTGCSIAAMTSGSS